MQKLLSLLLISVIGISVYFVTRWFNSPEELPREEVSATVLLERVRPVLKLITVEGDLNEIYHHRDTWNYHSMVRSLPAFQKEALLRIQARVSIGYDLNGLRFSADEASRTITMNIQPDPKILSIEHDVDYYDIKEGMFNSFSPRELSQLNRKAKQKVIEKVPGSGLFTKAREQRDQVVEMVRGIAETAGWKLVVGWEEPAPAELTLLQ